MCDCDCPNRHAPHYRTPRHVHLFRRLHLHWQLYALHDAHLALDARLVDRLNVVGLEHWPQGAPQQAQAGKHVEHRRPAKRLDHGPAQ
eukprot:356968-Chlamydomonas_euryale.AAC.33